MKNSKTIFVVTLSIALFLSACQSETSIPSSPYFPQLVDLPTASMEALIKGILILENGCLRLKEVEGIKYNDKSILLIWDPRFSFTILNGDIHSVVDAQTGEILASVGDYVSIGGGFIDDPSDWELKYPVPDECPRSYYMVGESITRDPLPSLGAHFPQIINGYGALSTIDMTSSGTLILENGCLRLKVNSGASFLLLWDLRFSTRTDAGVISVIDNATGETLATVGDYVELYSASSVSLDSVDFEFRFPIPEECSRPHMTVGTSITKIDPP